MPAKSIKRKLQSQKYTVGRKKGAAPGITVYYNPATGRELGRAPNTDLSKIPSMVKDARRAQQIWASYPFKERKMRILKIRDYIVDHADEIAAVVSNSSGKTK